jgi:hypothetical protein
MSIRTDAEIIEEGMKILLDHLTKEEVERFITLIKRENFDYNKWSENLPKFNSVEELSQATMENKKK